MELTTATRGYTYVTVAAALFAVNGSVSKVVLESGLDPAWLAALRCTGSAVGLGLILLASAPRRLRTSARELPALVLLGFAGAAMVQWLYFVAIDRVPIGIALLLEFTAPVFVALYVRFIRRQEVRPLTWLAIGLALAGLALVAQIWTDTGLDPIGVAAGIGAALCVATYFLVGSHAVAARDASSLTFYMLLFGAVFWAVAKPWWTFDASMITGTTSLLGAFESTSVPVWIAVVWIIVLGTLTPYSLNLAALRHISPTAAGVVGMSEPLGAGLVAWAWLGQVMRPIQIAGGLVVLVGIVLVQRSTTPVTAASSTKARPVAARAQPDQSPLPGALPEAHDIAFGVGEVGREPHIAYRRSADHG
ncbi:MAG TPA: EamA family transporter [Jiangellaceae bacterium]|nr:EamA family transporter [Jiangellaceae bacterium]